MEKLVDDKILSKIEELLELLTKNQDYQKYLLVSKKMKENNTNFKDKGKERDEDGSKIRADFKIIL